MEFDPPVDDEFVFAPPLICPVEPACWFDPERLPVTDDSAPTSETDLLFDELLEFEEVFVVEFEEAFD